VEEEFLLAPLLGIPHFDVRQKEMIKTILKLPLPVQVVAWLNFVLMVFTGITAIASIQSVSKADTIINFLTFALYLVILVAIFQKSKGTRLFILILSWLNIVMFVPVFLIAIFVVGFAAFFSAFPLLVSGITIWGLTSKESKDYYGITVSTPQAKVESSTPVEPPVKTEKIKIKKEPYILFKPREKVIPGMSLAEVKEVLAGRFILESEQIVGITEETKTKLYTFCDSRSSSNLFRFESENDIVTQVY